MQHERSNRKERGRGGRYRETWGYDRDTERDRDSRDSRWQDREPLTNYRDSDENRERERFAPVRAQETISGGGASRRGYEGRYDSGEEGGSVSGYSTSGSSSEDAGYGYGMSSGGGPSESFADQPRQREGVYQGKGPRGYRRSDERIREDVCEALTFHPYVDASEIEVTVNEGDVILTGSVLNRQMKYLAEECADVPGTGEIINHLRVQFRGNH